MHWKKHDARKKCNSSETLYSFNFVCNFLIYALMDLKIDKLDALLIIDDFANIYILYLYR